MTIAINQCTTRLKIADLSKEIKQYNFLYNKLMKWVGLLDCNNFFVSCERLFRPDLAKQPVVVLSSNDGCVVARSQEVKDMGIPMGVPYFKVKQEFEAAGVVVFSSNFTLYRDISARVMRVLREEVENMQQYSVDEAFFSVEEADVREATIRHIKTTVERKVGVPVSIGVAKTKTLAKVANHRAKKGPGVCILSDDMWQKESKSVPIGTLWGVGGGLSRKCIDTGISTPADLMQADSAQIARVFGVVGVRLQSELLGKPAEPLHSKIGLQHSIMSTRSFGEATDDLSSLEKALAHHVEHATKELREMGAVARSFKVLVRPSRFSDFAMQGIYEDVLLSEPTNDTRVFLTEAMRCLRSKHRTGIPYKKAGIIIFDITDAAATTSSLFGTVLDSGLMSVVDNINKKFGSEGVSFFGNNKQHALTKNAWNSGHKTTRWSDIPTVKAS